MRRKTPSGGGSLRGGFGGGYSGSNPTPTIANVGTGTGQVYKNTTAAINLRTLKQGTGINIVTSGDEVTIGAAAFSDVFWQVPVISIFDNTAALPVGPSVGDRYIALVTANGWTIDNIYEYNGATWDETTVIDGMGVVVRQFLSASIIGRFFVYAYTGFASYAWMPYFSKQAGEFYALPEKTAPTGADFLVIEDTGDSYRKKKISIANLPTIVSVNNATDEATAFANGSMIVIRTDLI